MVAITKDEVPIHALVELADTLRKIIDTTDPHDLVMTLGPLRAASLANASLELDSALAKFRKKQEKADDHERETGGGN